MKGLGVGGHASALSPLRPTRLQTGRLELSAGPRSHGSLAGSSGCDATSCTLRSDQAVQTMPGRRRDARCGATRRRAGSCSCVVHTGVGGEWAGGGGERGSPLHSRQLVATLSMYVTVGGAKKTYLPHFKLRMQAEAAGGKVERATRQGAWPLHD